ncbi:hypothetical protein GCM10012288_07220 [Malaciobacter pacificus]|uniref:beta-lactamase n=1 Tax=Malaciobacter pacificus TaxID=1080223 RepID=A0A5C2H6T1_9BACT|nr:tetratricopeptide repeat protein [Malaciobacter pacificus]QEP34009.1 Sel1 domain-containing protein [Malaciobacter pacificus]GGD35800.1 hypothetical protein GCM10012288_07220 [Malaciobacter pacificus]
MQNLFIKLIIFIFVINLSLYARSENDTNAVLNLKAYAVFKMGQYDEARAIWEDLAKKGNTTALINLANLFEQGNGVKKDRKEALKYIQKAAELNDDRAQYELGIEYEKGIHLPRDIDKAEYWLKKSCENENSDAYLAYGIMLATAKGKGVENITNEQKVEALKWLKLAKQEGESEAADYIRILEKK